MTKHINTDNTAANKDVPGSCWTWQAMLQIAVGVLLVTAAAFGYSLLHHPAVMIPTMMGAALLFVGVKAFLVCRDRPQLREHHHSSNGMTG
ncbi:MAG TPA: hypothetical protein VM011_10340 [Gammaproteobacteria bacterium]|nr:hypothetical protein [Gammaproteobacteria bacterium]